ncbi:alpha-1,2-fucosyltransferase [Vibrio sp. 10N.222.49.A3]|uniref:alpha-1,2-fucosyltransferase n=1 Tax=unclassified Vibrio TaxID=2614977 RepID=UPI00354D0B82
MSKKAVGFLQGGLGNQLFIYFSLVSVAQDNDLEPSFNKDSYGYDKFSRALGLELLGFDIKFESSYFFKNRYLRLIFMKFGRYLLSNRIFNNYHFEYRSNQHADFVINDDKDNYFFGYFQNEKYLNDEVVFDSYEGSEYVNSVRDKVQRKYSSEDTIAIHLRSYNEVKDEVCSIDKDYINAALLELNYNKNKDRILVFTDSIEFSSSVLSGLNYDYFDEGFLFTAEETLISISSFERIICSNSSFAWWGAYFSKSEKVVYPKDRGYKYYPSPCKNWHLV